MIKLNGKYTDATIMIDSVEDGVIKQTISMMTTEPFTNPVKIMPDTHEGIGSVIGFTEKLNGKVCPNTIGVDIGCGMTAYKYDITSDEANLSFDLIDKQLRKLIPVGFSINTNKHELPNSIFNDAQSELFRFTDSLNMLIDSHYEPKIYSNSYLAETCAKINTTVSQVLNACGTLGGGNHFIEIDKGKDDFLWSIVHSGSRNFGLKIANYHQKKAGTSQLSFLNGEDAYDYFVDMIFAQKYASLSRKIMSNIIQCVIDTPSISSIESIHNFIDPEDMMIRKGAIRSYEGELMIIPFNMRDGTIICEGKSNPDWNYSAPHGAGRVMSRGVAKRTLKIEKYEADMIDVWSSSVNSSTLDEAPDCYKNFEIIMNAITPTASIKDVLKPLYNIKG